VAGAATTQVINNKIKGEDLSKDVGKASTIAALTGTMTALGTKLPAVAKEVKNVNYGIFRDIPTRVNSNTAGIAARTFVKGIVDNLSQEAIKQTTSNKK